MSYQNKKVVVEDSYIGSNMPERKFFASYPNSLPKELTITFGCRGRFEVVIKNDSYVIKKVVE